MTDREIILICQRINLKSRIAELETEKLGMLTTIFNLEQKTADLERRLEESCAQNVADNYLVPALSQEVDNLKARNAELVGVLETIDGEICSFCTGELCFKLCVENQPGIYRMCNRRETIQSVIRAGKGE